MTGSCLHVNLFENPATKDDIAALRFSLLVIELNLLIQFAGCVSFQYKLMSNTIPLLPIFLDLDLWDLKFVHYAMFIRLCKERSWLVGKI